MSSDLKKELAQIRKTLSTLVTKIDRILKGPRRVRAAKKPGARPKAPRPWRKLPVAAAQRRVPITICSTYQSISITPANSASDAATCWLVR